MVNRQKLRMMPDWKSACAFRGSDLHRASCFLRPRQFRRVWGIHNLPGDFQDKMTEEDTSPKFTPALTTSSHETVIAPDDPFLHTPNKADAPNTSALSSFLFHSRSFEIEVCRFFRLSNNAILILKNAAIRKYKGCRSGMGRRWGRRKYLCNQRSEYANDVFVSIGNNDTVS